MSQLLNAPRLSVAIIVRDAADALRETLSSIKSMADEVVVADTGSQDQSLAVAKEFDAKVVETHWNDDFSAARNFCLSHVTGDWVLWLDAGESLSPEDMNAVRQQLQDAPSPSCVYAILVEVPPSEPAAAAEQIARVRLFPKHPQLQFAGRVRESIEQAFNSLSQEIRPLPVCIRRTKREHDSNLKQEKARRNIRLAEEEVKDVGAQTRLLNCLGDAFQTLQDNERAAQFFRHALQGSEPASSDMLESFYGIITSLNHDPKYHDEQLSVCIEALEVFPMDAQLLCAMGGYLQRQGQTELAMKSYHTAYRYGQVNPGVWHVGRVHEIAATCLNLTLQMLHRDEEALELLQESLGKYPNSARLRRHLIELNIKLGKRDDALAEVAKLPSEFPKPEALRSAVRGACLATANNWVAAKAYLKTSYNAGSRDPICLRWYVTTLIASGEVEEATPILEEWLEVEPTSALAQQYLAALGDENKEQPDSGRQVRIDAPNAQQSHLTTSPTRTPNQAADTRLPHRR